MGPVIIIVLLVIQPLSQIFKQLNQVLVIRIFLIFQTFRVVQKNNKFFREILQELLWYKSQFILVNVKILILVIIDSHLGPGQTTLEQID